ncbi:MAG: bifunctional diguanylate cyclase/phosphodiesterase [Woeseiaceae bacterium]|nr:bifunctional diguanylate cyclase/phosphodiesterase [Woeseiaceae bacterium]
MSSAGDITQQIRRLSLTDTHVGGELEEATGSALLLTRDRDALKWGARWLKQSAFRSVVTESNTPLEVATTMQPEVIVVDASLLGPDRKPVYQLLLDAPDIKSSVIVLCSSQRDIGHAMDAGAFDTAMKPWHWQAVSNRAAHALAMHRRDQSLAVTNDALKEALAVANTARERLNSHKNFEPVTGLPNKTIFVDMLRRGMRAAKRDGGNLAVFVIGFTRFRLIIEAMGQEQADRTLLEIGRSLDGSLRSLSGSVEPLSSGLRTAAIASLDQFRFGLMLTVPEDSEALRFIQQQLLETLSLPIQVSGQTVYLSPCLGVALYPQDAEDVDRLLQRADNAMRDAQSRGGGFKYYCAETDAAAARKLRIEHMLHEALDRKELSLAYQPIVDMQSGDLFAAEALLRWPQAEEEGISAEEFVAVAEESGLMIRAGRFVLSRACWQIAQWRDKGVDAPCVCVNVSKIQLTSPDFAETVREMIERHAIEPAMLELEISERGVLSGNYDVIDQLHELKRLGVRLSIDDFGTGESAIRYLKELPVDALKIDRSYISGLIENDKDAAIASAMIALGQRLNLKVVAEGVETEWQFEILKELGCDAYQGFLVSKAVSAAEFATRFTGLR